MPRPLLPADRLWGLPLPSPGPPLAPRPPPDGATGAFAPIEEVTALPISESVFCPAGCKLPSASWTVAVERVRPRPHSVLHLRPIDLPGQGGFESFTSADGLCAAPTHPVVTEYTQMRGLEVDGRAGACGMCGTCGTCGTRARADHGAQGGQNTVVAVFC